MVAAFDHCLFGRGGAAPSIDTAMHGLVEAAHVDHLHPDSGIALRDRGRRRSADARRASAIVSRGCRGGAPASSSGWTSRRSGATSPDAIGVDPRRPRHHGLGRHARRRARRTRSRSSGRAERVHRRPRPTRAVRATSSTGTSRSRRPLADERAAALLPLDPRPRIDRPTTGRPLHRHRRRARLRRPRSRCRRLAALGTSCPDHFLRTKVRPMVLDVCRRRPRSSDVEARLRELHAAYRDEYRPTTNGTRPPTARRCAAPIRPSSWFRASACSASGRQADGTRRGRVLRQRHQRDAWRRGALDLRADPGVGEVPHRVLVARGGEARAAPKPKPLAARIAFVTGGGSGIGRAIALRLAAEGACVVVADIDAGERARRSRARSAGRMSRSASHVT